MIDEQGKQMAMVLDRGRAAVVAVMQSGMVRAEDVNRLRREVFADGCVSRDEADALFALEASDALKCAEWTSFFVEAITSHVVWEMRPTGVVNESQGEWLIARADEAATLNALALLVNVLSEAHRAPAWFLAAVRARAARGWKGVDVSRLTDDAERAEAA